MSSLGFIVRRALAEATGMTAGEAHDAIDRLVSLAQQADGGTAGLREAAQSSIDHAQRIGHFGEPEEWQEACRLFRVRCTPDDAAKMAKLRAYIEDGLLVVVRPNGGTAGADNQVRGSQMAQGQSQDATPGVTPGTEAGYRTPPTAPQDPHAPAEVFLQLYGDSSPFEGPVDYKAEEVTWCWHRINEHDVRYVQAASQGAPAAEVVELRDYKALCDLWDEANALGTVLGNQERLMLKIARLRDEFGARKLASQGAEGRQPLSEKIERLRHCWETMRWCKETSDAIEALLSEAA
jgi:hypothetical protein